MGRTLPFCWGGGVKNLDVLLGGGVWEEPCRFAGGGGRTLLFCWGGGGKEP